MAETLDSAIEQLEKELPGFRWNLARDGDIVRCVLTSQDFKSHIWEAGGKTMESIVDGPRVVACHEVPANAVRRAIEIAKREMKGEL